jgi:hypothetical protein
VPKERKITERVVGGMCLSTTGIELVRVEGPFDWLADRDPQYRHTAEQLEGFEVEWYQQKYYDAEHRDGYVRMWKKGEPCPYAPDEYDFIYAEDYYEDEDAH